MSDICPGAVCHHISFSPPGINIAREKSRVKPYKCGECLQHFSAICVLHTHLRGRSYRYEEETMTAYPLDTPDCSSESVMSYPSDENETLETEVSESTEKYYKVYKLRKGKKNLEDSSSIHIIKVVDDPPVVKPGTCTSEDENVSYNETGNVGDEECSTADVDTVSEIHNTGQYAAKEHTAIQGNLCIGNSVEHIEQIHQPGVSGISDQNNRKVVYSQIQNQSVTSEILIPVKEETKEKLNADDEILVVEPAVGGNEIEAINSDMQVQTLYYTLESSKIDSQVQVEINNGGVKQEVEGYTPMDKLNPGFEDKSLDTYLNIPGAQENVDIQTTVVDTIPATSSGDVDLEEAVAAFDEFGVPQSQNKQLEITLFGMKTNEDGSLRLVVGENDAGVFNTPVGDEILKALKTQAHDIPADGSVQVVFNYSDSSMDKVPIENDSSGNAVEVLTYDQLEAYSPRPPKRQRTNEKDVDLLPKFKINLPNADTQSEATNDSGETSTQELKAKVFLTSQEKLSTAEALNILTECNLGMHDDKISKIQPINAKGGELYVVDLMALPHKKDCRYDKYLWVNCVTRKFPLKNPIMKKHVFKIRLPNSQFSDAFQRHMFQFIEEARYCIIHYIGYESIFQPLSHGNSKSGAIFNRTCPSVLQELKELSKEEGVTANRVYRQIEALNVPEKIKGLRAPRNLSQIKNHFRYAKRAREKQEQTVQIKEELLDDSGI